MVADQLRAGLRLITGLGAGAVRSGVLHPIRPDRAARLPLPIVRFGTSPATLGALAALRFPGRTAVIDDDGSLTYEELEQRAAALAGALAAMLATAPGVGAPDPAPPREDPAAPDAAPREEPAAPDAAARAASGGARIGIMCRNHRGFIEATLAGSRLPGDVVFLNTDFSPPQLRSVLERERVGLLVLDEEFLPVADEAGFTGPRVVGRHSGDLAYPTIADLAVTTCAEPAPSGRTGRMVILTSGTTGTPKGAQHELSLPDLVRPAIAHAVRVPMRSGRPLLLAPPLYHVLGLGYLNLALALGCPVVLLTRFTPEAALEAIERHGAHGMVTVPVMLQRLLETTTAARAAGRPFDTSALHVVISGGAPLLPHLAEEFTTAFGDVLYNVYGATETGWATIATPEDLRAAPGTVGRVSYGVTLKLLDDDGEPVPAGEVGRVFFGGGGINFSGYTGGGGRDTAERLVATGDLGHFDEAGRLFIDGRVDDMIVSGGENVFPGEVENLLARHEGVSEVAVTGTADEKFGQRLVAHVVRTPGSQVTSDELRAYVRERLARFKVPRDIEFVDELPRTTTGKIRHGDLRKG